MTDQPSSLTSIVRKGFDRAIHEFSAQVVSQGFLRTKRGLWVRPHEYTADVISFHRHGSTYGAPRTASLSIRVHFAIRVLNDPFPALAANGPDSDTIGRGKHNYHLRFNAQSGSTFDRCIQDLVKLLIQEGEPWFRRFRPLDSLLNTADSPLGVEARKHLQAALDGKTDPSFLKVSSKVLGLKSQLRNNSA